MSTRSLIAIKTDIGIRAIYCHHDGYIEHNGVILQEHYKDREKVSRLIEGGDTSTLAEEVADCRFYNDDNSKTATYANYEELMSQLGGGIEYIYLFLNRDVWAVVSEKTARNIGVQKLSDAVAELKRSQMRAV